MPASVFPDWVFGTRETTEATVEQGAADASVDVSWPSSARPAGIAIVRAMLYSRETGQLHKDAVIDEADVAAETVKVRFDALDVAQNGRYWLVISAQDLAGTEIARSEKGNHAIRVYGEGVYRTMAQLQQLGQNIAGLGEQVEEAAESILEFGVPPTSIGRPQFSGDFTDELDGILADVEELKAGSASVLGYTTEVYTDRDHVPQAVLPEGYARAWDYQGEGEAPADGPFAFVDGRDVYVSELLVESEIQALVDAGGGGGATLDYPTGLGLNPEAAHSFHTSADGTAVNGLAVKRVRGGGSANWSYIFESGATGGGTVQGGQAVGPTSDHWGYFCIAKADLPSGQFLDREFLARFDGVEGVASGFGIAIIQDANNLLFVGLRDTGDAPADRLVIMKRVAGVDTTLAQVSVATNGHRGLRGEVGALFQYQFSGNQRIVRVTLWDLSLSFDTKDDTDVTTILANATHVAAAVFKTGGVLEFATDV